MLDKIENAFVKFDIVLKWLMTAIFGGMTIIIFLQVIFRYVLKQSLPWSEELARYMFIWITFVGGMVAARRGQHIGMEMAQDALPKFMKKYAKAFASLLTSGFFGVIFYFCIKVWPKMMMQTSPALGLPMAYPYLGIITGCILMCLWYLTYAILLLCGKKEDKK